MGECKQCSGTGMLPWTTIGDEAIARWCPECGPPKFLVRTDPYTTALERVARAAGEWRDALEWHRQPLRSAREHSESAGNLRKKMLALESALTALEEGGESDG